MKQLLLLLLIAQPMLLQAQTQKDSLDNMMPAGRQGWMNATDSVIAPKSPMEKEWDAQTVDGTNLRTEKATAGFYQTTPQAGIYAFYTDAPRGKVLRIRNVNNDSVTFVKVIGPLPQRRVFKGCSLGLSNEAKEALGVRDNKAMCEVSYAEE